MKIGRNYFALIAEAHVPALTGTEVDITPSFIVQADELAGAVFIAPVPGAPGFINFTIGGTYAVGDDVRITITSNITNRQLYRKSYVHTVEAGGTATTAIATALGAKIAADLNQSNTPYSNVVVLGSVITVTQLDDDKQGLKSVEYTDSALGNIVAVATPTVISEGQPSDLIDRGIDAANINLAFYDTVRIDLHADAAIPFIDSEGATAREIYWYGTPGNGAAFAALINSL